MGVRQIRSVLFYVMCVIFVPGSASEFNAEDFYEIYSKRMDDIMLENKLLRLELEEAVRNMGHQADRITIVEETTKIMEKQVDKVANLEEATKKCEEKADRIAHLEQTTKQIKKQTEKIINLRKVTKKMKKQAGRITKLEETTNNIKMQTDIVASFKRATKKMEKQACRIKKLEETTNNIKKQVDKLASLEEVTNNMEQQACSITKLEETVNKIENIAKGIMNIENVQQKLNNQIAKLENNTLNNEKAISDLTLLARENDMKSVKASESSIIALKHDVMKLFTAVRKMVPAEKMFLRGMKKSYDEKLSIFTNEVKLLMSTLNDKFRDFSETLQEKVDKESVHHTKNLKTSNAEIQQLETRIVNVETRQGKKAAFTVNGAYGQTNGILKFTSVKLNEGSVYSSRTGQFTCPFPGLYVFIASIIETSRGDNFIFCYIRKNGAEYVNMYSRQGTKDSKFATDGWGPVTGAATVHLVKGDRVYVWCRTATRKRLHWSSFTGFLVSADP
ncbi:golgin subfamily A member 4-like [Mercenaria mercenaria]|uniref:golgin subfamily A member 4-like n=1 Tax=Mercenaria mercenaria TaxID=6596 RepID=UPI00234F0152|nr:golgin subfamily A member 4-like [Mercenaria mercenaria]